MEARILRSLLARLEDATSGEIIAREFHAELPQARVEQARLAAEVLGDTIFEKFPFVEGAGPVAVDRTELVLNRTWRPALSSTGVAGMPELESAGNVLRPFTAVELSLRLPPTVDGPTASRALGALLEAEPPYGARVSFEPGEPATGWEAPALAAWLEAAVDAASQQ